MMRYLKIKEMRYKVKSSEVILKNKIRNSCKRPPLSEMT